MRADNRASTYFRRTIDEIRQLMAHVSPQVLGGNLGAIASGGLTSIVAAQLGWATISWVAWCVNVIGLVLLGVLGTAALASAVCRAVRNKFPAPTY